MVVADCDLRAALHAQRGFDAGGHYSREDVLAPQRPPTQVDGRDGQAQDVPATSP
jgi:hypothetical protein